MANRLAGETSPYLLQHATNPVDWYPWGEEALTTARVEGKPIFLSIGYSACHWCHVMERESFESSETAAILNEHFVAIKVDREERPDLDAIYMAAVQALTGRGGWPMSVFLTPDGHPFYGGTYFPPQSRYGMPAFADVLRSVAAAWSGRRDELVAGAVKVLEAIRGAQAQPSAAGDLRPSTAREAFHGLRDSFDRKRGGWGSGPKFPQPMVLEFLLRYHKSSGDRRALEMVTQTLEAMARGGLYDQIGGGFHRYSVDERWLVPHFEKMLYDNAQLARVYLHAWQVTGDAFYRAIVEETLDYVVREMTYAGPDANAQQLRHRPQLPTNAAGVAFYSTQDADSEGEEGRFYVWTLAEIQENLGVEADEFVAAYGVTENGNFEGRNILEFAGDVDQRPALADARRALLAIREDRVHPGRDDKVLTSWNGLMLAAFSEAARALGRDDYRLVAEQNARFLLQELRLANGRLLHSWKEGEAKLNGYLEDYGYLIEGLIELYQTTFDSRWFVAARELAEAMIAHFGAEDGGFFDTSDDHETLITRPRDMQDNATPSGNAMAVTALLKLAGLTGSGRAIDIAHQALSQVQPLLTRYPLGFGQWLQALAYVIAEPREVALIGDPDSADTRALLGVLRERYRPFQVVALGSPDVRHPVVPLLQDRGQVADQATAYVCRGFTCQAPVTEPEVLEAQTESA